MQKIIGEFWEKNWLSGVEVENVLGIKGAFWEKNLLSWGRGAGGGIFGICGTFSVQNYTFLSEFVAPLGLNLTWLSTKKKSKKKA